MQGVDSNAIRSHGLPINHKAGLPSQLLVDHHEPAPGEEDELTCLPGHGDGLTVHGQPADLTFAAERRSIGGASSVGFGHDEVGCDGGHSASPKTAAARQADVGGRGLGRSPLALTNDRGVGD